MSRDTIARADDTVGVLTQVIGSGLRRIDGELNRLGTALQRSSPDAEYLPVAAFDALDGATAQAAKLRKTIASLGLRHPASSRAIAGLDSLVTGLRAMRRLWISYSGAGTKGFPTLEGQVSDLLAQARAELAAADRALGCPWGCPAPRARPKLPGLGGGS